MGVYLGRSETGLEKTTTTLSVDHDAPRIVAPTSNHYQLSIDCLFLSQRYLLTCYWPQSCKDFARSQELLLMRYVFFVQRVQCRRVKI